MAAPSNSPYRNRSIIRRSQSAQVADVAFIQGEAYSMTSSMPGRRRAAAPPAGDVNQKSPTSRATSRLDVVEDVADHPGLREVDLELATGSFEHSGLRLAAVAFDREFGDCSVRMMRTPLHARQRDAERREQFA